MPSGTDLWPTLVGTESCRGVAAEEDGGQPAWVGEGGPDRSLSPQAEMLTENPPGPAEVEEQWLSRESWLREPSLKMGEEEE